MTLILGRHPKGSVERAEAFFSEFLKSGIFGDGHVKPQSEYLGHIKDCDIPMHFIGAVENISADWSRTGTLKYTSTLHEKMQHVIIVACQVHHFCFCTNQ